MSPLLAIVIMFFFIVDRDYHLALVLVRGFFNQRNRTVLLEICAALSC
jgi:hypothetical protein